MDSNRTHIVTETDGVFPPHPGKPLGMPLAYTIPVLYLWMKKVHEMKKSAGLLLCIFFLFSPLGAEDILYTNGSVARLSCIEGDVFLQRAAEMGFENAVLNMPVTEGDRLGTTDGRAELYITRGKYIRLNHNTKIDILKLPDNSSDLVQIRVWSGSCYLRINHLDQDKGLELHTPDLSAYVLDRGLFRFDIRENQETELFVFRGLLEAALEDGSVLIKADQRLEAIDGRATSNPTKFLSNTEDSFDRWNGQRDYELQREADSRYLPEELTDFETELADSGRWDDVPPYGPVWVPFGTDTGWRPYYNGRWIWLGLPGWTWLPYESWGWVTCHYGRWHWNTGHGWFWIPTTVWGPAWVSWFSGPDYWAWAPLSYDGYPGVIVNDIYYSRYTGRTIPPLSRTLTVVHKDQLQAPRVAGVALSPSGLQQAGQITLTPQRQPLRPSSAGRMDGTSGSRIFLKDGMSGSERMNTPAKLRPADRAMERRNIQRRYPSSSSIRSRMRDTGRSGSTLGQIYSRIGKSSSVSKAPASPSQRKIPTRSITPRSSSRPSSMRAPSRSSSSTKKVRKK